MNMYLWLALGLLVIVIIWDCLEEISEQEKTTYTTEEIKLAEYLEKKQAINGIYLEAVAEILRYQKR